MDSNFEIFLKEVQDPYTITAERALQILSYPCFSPAASSIGKEKPFLIFVTYMRLLRLRLPEALVSGIWEDILRKTVKYTQYVSSVDNPGVYTSLEWLKNALHSPHNCPNPYIRLELFGLMRILQSWGKFDWYYITNTFIHKISEIKPCRLYSSGNEDEVLFGVIDLKYIMNLCFRYGGLKQIISNDIERLFMKSMSNNLRFIREHFVNYHIISVDSKEIRFLLHVVELIGVFAVKTGSITNPKQQTYTLMVCCTLLRDTIRGLMNDIETFRVVVKKLQIHESIAETLHVLTSAVTNLKKHRMLPSGILLSVRNEITELLGYSKGYFREPYELPRLILNRQIHGSTKFVKQHSLLLGGQLQPIYNMKDQSVEYKNYMSNELFYFTYSEKTYNDNSSNYSDDSETSDNFENSSSNESNDYNENQSIDKSNDDRENSSNDKSSDDGENSSNDNYSVDSEN